MFRVSGSGRESVVCSWKRPVRNGPNSPPTPSSHAAPLYNTFLGPVNQVRVREGWIVALVINYLEVHG